MLAITWFEELAVTESMHEGVSRAESTVVLPEGGSTSGRRSTCKPLREAGDMLSPALRDYKDICQNDFSPLDHGTHKVT